MRKSPNEGGCWFCYHDDERPMYFSREFDSWFHEQCLKDALKIADNPEAEIIAAEFSDTNWLLTASESTTAGCILQSEGEMKTTMTNGDNIRSMNDEQLAQELAYNIFFHHRDDHFCKGDCPEPYDSCISCMLKWLKSEIAISPPKATDYFKK